MNKEQAEGLAVKALVWLANNQDRLEQFLNASGALADNLRQRAQDPEFLGFVLDFMLLDDQTILAFCDENHLPPENIQTARAVLSGDLPNWT
ncbi:MAG: DUF3572 domain-containing protein [Rhodobacteraceae bacterium]|nr:DUF3572 domain-containing protein [Paracoccaceae bacterium]